MKKDSPLHIVPQQMEMVGLPKPTEAGHRTFAEAMKDPKMPIEKKLHTIGLVCSLDTANGLTKADLLAMLKVSYAVPDEAETGDNYHICGRCECALDERYRYCPMCGAKIDRRKDSEQK